MAILDRASLVAAAGVDPWALLAQVAAGDPDQIEELGAAFYRAGGHTTRALAPTETSAPSTSTARTGHTGYYNLGTDVLRTMVTIADGDHGAFRTVDAPNYRSVKDLITGPPITAVTDGWHGAVEQGENLIHDREDAVDTVRS